MQSSLQRCPRVILSSCHFLKLHESLKKFKVLMTIFLSLVLFVSTTFSQTTTTFPSPDRCTSKDLTLVGAALTGSGCNSCTGVEALTRTLTLSINNTTSSTRTSFAFWGTLEITHADGSITTSSISGCNGPILKNQVNALPYGSINYICGDALKIKNLFLAWTDAAPGSTCASINSATINPKCGTLPEIQVNSGVNGSFANTNVTCFNAATGAINLTPFGGTPTAGSNPYTYLWVASNGGTVPSGQSTSQDLTGCTVGTYSVTITDSKGCTITKSTNITGPTAGLTLGTCSKTDATCAGGDGTVSAGTVTNNAGTVTYSWKNSANTVVGTSANLTSLAADTYTLTVTDNCTSKTCSVTVGAPPVIATPAATVTQQPTCSIAKGTVTVNPVDGSTTYKLSQQDVVKYTAVNGVFSSVDPGTYVLTASVGVCTKTGNSVTVNPQPATPGKPAFTVTQPSLCGDATGTLTICQSISGYNYKIGSTTTPGNGAAITFISLAAGSNPSLTVINTNGNCSSAPYSCNDAVETCTAQGVTRTSSPINEQAVLQPTIKAFPNPFNDRVKFVVSTPEGGNANLEVFNMVGQKVRTVYNGHISAGSQTFELSVPAQKSATLIYVLKIGEKVVTGKLLQLHQ
jgi:hypothetical protein